MAQPIYLYNPAHRSLLVEIYFPKKAAYQGTIFTALERGYNEEVVKKNLRGKVRELLTEFSAYPFNLLDPYRYGTLKKPKHPESAITKALKRIKLYESQFYGWSMYEVDGVFFNRHGKTYEESTQIVRLIFRFGSKKIDRYAKKIGCDDVLRSIVFFILRERGQIDGETPWDESMHKRYMAVHDPWPTQSKRRYAEKHFPKIAKEVRKWIEDCALFTYGYLVRQFSERVLETKRLEEEIWVSSFFNVTVNAIKKSKKKPAKTERVEL